MKIGVLTGGGDVPGLNACIRAITLSADDLGWEVLGLKRGWEGVLAIDPDDPASVAENSLPLNRSSVRSIDRLGGTILHTSRLDPRTTVHGDQTKHVLSVLEKLGVEAITTLGGDGTLRFSAHLSSKGVPVISIPKTMDNDVFGTDYSIGFSTAVTRSVEAINALRTTVGSHERIGIVELFGRRSGETALLAGFLAQVDRTVIAEIPVDLDVLLPLLARDKSDSGEGYAMCVVSEGATIAGEPPPDDSIRSLPASDREEASVSYRISEHIKRELGFGTVVQELAYLMRAGEPDAMDRMVGLAFGALAVQLMSGRQAGRMVALKDGRYDHVPIGTLETGRKSVDVPALYDPTLYRAKLMHIEQMPMFLY